MGNQNALPSERAGVVGTIDPDSYASGNQLSDAVDMGKFGSLLAIVQVGDTGSESTVDLTLQEATTAGATYSNITGKSIAAISADDKVAIINLRGEEMTSGKQFVKAQLTVNTTAAEASVILLGFDPRFGPASDGDIADVVEIVA